MAICERCGAEFDLEQVKSEIDRMYGPETYDNYYDGRIMCEACAVFDISADYGIGDDQIEDMGSGWDPYD